MNPETIFMCPLCRNRLVIEEKKMTCPLNHQYDISREGYVNLLLPNMKRSSSPGDSAEMIRSRNRFLNAGHYSALPEYICGIIKKHLPETENPRLRILDAGCGEGYVLSVLEKNLRSTPAEFFGIDISKDAVKTASRRSGRISFAVAGLFSMPVADSTVDCLLNIFAPSPAPEFGRVLTEKGIIIHVHPGEQHLLSLRENLFTGMRPLRKKDRLEATFTLCSTEELKYNFNIEGKENIADLVDMTPYAWKTGRERLTGFLTHTGRLGTTAHFILSVFSK